MHIAYKVVTTKMAINQIFLQNFKKKVIYDKFLNKKIRKTS